MSDKTLANLTLEEKATVPKSYHGGAFPADAKHRCASALVHPPQTVGSPRTTGIIARWQPGEKRENETC